MDICSCYTKSDLPWEIAAMSNTVFSGGCQCGAVRYEASTQPNDVSYCHCRMCQKAFGAPFAILAQVRRTDIQFVKEAPSIYRSSSLAERGFCSHCGTPLTFAYNDSDWISVSIGSLDEPERFPPNQHYGVESLIHWLHLQDDLPRHTTEAAAGDQLMGMVNHQHPDQK
jgi:hypothetical protein